MNETIKQLCEQSKVYANESTKDFTGNEPVVWMDYYTEKFAELIVRECIRTIQMGISRDGNNTEKFHRSMRHIKQVKEHFGIEE